MASVSAQTSARPTSENASARLRGKGEIQGQSKSSRRAFGEITNNVHSAGSLPSKEARKAKTKRSQAGSRKPRKVDLDFENLPDVETMIPYAEPLHEREPSSSMDFRGESRSFNARHVLQEPPGKWEELPTVPNSSYSFVLASMHPPECGKGESTDRSAHRSSFSAELASFPPGVDEPYSKETVNADIDRFFEEMGFI